MSEAFFVKQEIATFQKEHPAEDGWRLHLISPAAHSTFMPKLPAFLRAKLPGAFEETIATDIAFVTRRSMTRGSRRKRLTQLPFKQTGPGLDESTWLGDLRFHWEDSPIHVRRRWIPPGEGIPKPPLTLIAVKSDQAFERFFDAGIRFVAVKNRAMKTSVYVVNGPNYPRPKHTWEDLVLPTDVKRQIRDSFESFLASKSRYRDLGLPYRRGFLLVGPPGNGKTLVTKVIAGSYRVNIVALQLKSDLEERVVDEAFKLARANPPCVMLLEDLDKLVQATRISMSYFLNKLDGMDAPEGVLVIATSNEPERLDPALLHRPSRFDRVWEFKLPEEDERMALLRLRGARYFSEEALRRSATGSAGFSMAYVQETVVSALMLAVQQKTTPSDEHLAEALRQLTAQIKTAANGIKRIGAPASVGFAQNGHFH